jgi:purine-nucleoside phosphorylase
MPSVRGASIETNVLIKKQLPVRGVVSSNPKRMERLLHTLREQGLLQGIKSHTNSGWGIQIWTAFFKGVEYFFSVVPIGSTGSGFAFFEMYAAGAQAILRFGAGSDPKRDSKSPREIVIVDQATNMDSLQYAAGINDEDRSSIIQASDQLITLLSSKAHEKEMPERRLICFNVDDYHAYNFSELFEQGEAMRERIKKSDASSAPKDCCWDMETAALYCRAAQFGMHAATVLVPVQATAALERDYYNVILESLRSFAPTSVAPFSSGHRRSWSRDSRIYSSNDRIGIEEPLFFVDDVETGNNLFAD